MKTKKIYTIVVVLLLAFDIFFRRIVLEQPNLFGLADLAFLFGIFTPLVNSDKKKKYYKIAFVMLAILSLVNEGIVKNYGGDNWANFGFEEELRATLGTPVEIRNDADLAGLGEAVYGAGRDASIVAYFGIGTGVGTARIVNGNIDSGAYDFEAGHQIVDARTCASLESLVSGGTGAFSSTRNFRLQPNEKVSLVATAPGYKKATVEVPVNFGDYTVLLGNRGQRHR